MIRSTSFSIGTSIAIALTAIVTTANAAPKEADYPVPPPRREEAKVPAERTLSGGRKIESSGLIKKKQADESGADPKGFARGSASMPGGYSNHTGKAER